MAHEVDDREGWHLYINDVAQTLGVDPALLPVDGLLELVGKVARRVYRPMVPVTGYLLGMAVGAGMDPADALTKVDAILPADED